MLVKKRNLNRVLAFTIMLALLAVSGDWAQEAKGDAVAVTATVNSSVTCTSSGSPAALGVLSSGAIASVFATTTMGCNSGTGCALSVYDLGNGTNGGLSTTPAYLIPSPNAAFAVSTTLVAGTEGYGISAVTSSAGSGGVLTLASIYASTTLGLNGVGGLVTSTLSKQIASSTVAISGREVVVAYKAAISGTTQAGSFSDTVTYSCVAN